MNNSERIDNIEKRLYRLEQLKAKEPHDCYGVGNCDICGRGF